MTKDKTTPEEKLLRIIEEFGRIKSGSFFKRFSFKGQGIKKPGKILSFDKDVFSLASLTNTLIGLAVMLTLFLIIQMFISNRNDSVMNLSEGSRAKKKSDKEIVALLPLSDYLGELTSGKMLLGVSPEVAQASEVEPQENYTEVLANLKLVGIIWSDNPQAMIENAAEAKTLLLNKGDEIGKVKIKNIYQDRVILGLDNQEWELR